MQRKHSFPQWYQIIVLALALFAFLMTGLVAERVFEGVPHLEDELAYLFQARVFAGGQLVVESPEMRSAYWQPFVIDSNTTGYRFGKYTPGWPALLALGVAMGQLWVVNGFLAALTVALVYRFGREVYSPEVGLIAAILTAFSPAALLLNGSLMSHTAGLFWAMLFVYAYWRMEQGRKTLIWATVAGLGLGMLAASRPLTTVAIGTPFVVWSGLKLLKALAQRPNPEEAEDEKIGFQPNLFGFWQTLKPLLLLSLCTLILASSIPLFSWVATGNPRQNLYELVWPYDRVGFGQDYGRNTHRIAKGFNHARFDLTLTAADLFGWQFEPIGEEEVDHLLNQADYYPARGYSFLLLPFGLIIGIFFYEPGDWKNRLMWFTLWALLAFYWAIFPHELSIPTSNFWPIFNFFGIKAELIDDPTFSWFWVITALGWLYLPLINFLNDKKPQAAYTWLLMTLVLGIVVVQMTYWIGSQRYSTRYYYEALAAAALLTALPLGWLAEQHSANGRKQMALDVSLQALRFFRKLIVPAVLGLSVFTLYFYSSPRIDVLYHFNGIRGDLITEVEAARVDERPILVIVNGPTAPDSERVRWTAYGALLAVTSPYLDSDIVVVRDTGGMRSALIAAYPDRQVIDVDAVYYSSEVRQPE